MGGKRAGVWLAVIWLTACLCFPLFSAMAAGGDAVSEDIASAMLAENVRSERALLIGVDDFVSKPSTYPSSTNNVYAMQEVFQMAREPLEVLLIPGEPVVTEGELAALIQEAFGDAQAGDVSYLYISTHGVYDPESGEEAALLLSDGLEENRVTAAQLEAALEGIQGQKVLILDACNSGAFIGKGEANFEKAVHFLGTDYKVITSSGALEESWYWNAGQAEGLLKVPEDGGGMYPGPRPARQGAFYFTQELLLSLSPRYGYPADSNRDGLITLMELYDYLLLNHPASTPQVYPQRDDFVFFRYDLSAEQPQGSARSPIWDVTFSDTILDREDPSITLEYIALRPVRVGYQIVYHRDGKWDFDGAQLLFDDVERFTAFGDQEGAVSAGRKVRTLRLDLTEQEAFGYMLVQLVSIDAGRVTVHGGRVLCVPPASGDLALRVDAAGDYALSDARELSVFVQHAYPCALSVAVVNAQDEVIIRLCHRRSTRPSQTDPAGSLFYWDGADKNGNPVPEGVYRIRASGIAGEVTYTVMSGEIEIRGAP